MAAPAPRSTEKVTTQIKTSQAGNPKGFARAGVVIGRSKVGFAMGKNVKNGDSAINSSKLNH
jgi:hypothetical protein